MNFLIFLERQSRVSSTSTLSLDQFSKEPEINFQEIEPTAAELNKTEKNLEPVAGELSNTDKSRTLTPGMDPNSMKAYSCAMAWKDRSKLSLKRAKSEGRRRSKVWTKSMNSAITGHLMSETLKIFFSYSKGGFFSESAMRFLDLQSSKKDIPNSYPELEI